MPPSEQIRAQVLAHVAGGRLRPGDRLPTIRAPAGDLGVAAGTVARAYRELEATGVVVTRARAAGMSDAEVLDVVRGALLRPEPARATG